MRGLVAILLLAAGTCLAQFNFQDQAMLGQGSATTVVGDYNYAGIPGLYIQLFANGTTNWTGSTSGFTPAAWLDMTANGNDLTNDTHIVSSSTPSYSHNGPNGFYAVDFSASAASFATLALSNAIETFQATTIIVVATEVSDSSTSGNPLYDSHAGSKEALHLGTAHPSLNAGTAVSPANFANTSNWFIFSTVFNGFNSSFRTNGQTCKMVFNPGGQGVGQLMIGRNSDGSAVYNGKMAAMLVWNRALLTNELSLVEYELNSKYALGYTISTNGFDEGGIWAQRVVNNGGATPSATSQQAITAFAQGLKTDGIVAPYSITVYAPDSLIASTTPVVGSVGSDPWVNHNFVIGDLTVNGLKGNGSSKYLDTGINVSTMLLPDNTSIAVYLYAVGTTASPLDVGAQDGSGQNFAFYPDDAGTTFFDSYTFTAGGRVTATPISPFYGYYCGSRTSTTSSTVYYAYSGHAQSSLGSIATVAGGFPNLNEFVFDLNLSGSPYSAGWSDSQQSLTGFLRGLTSTQSGSLFSRTQTLRTSFGGGYR